MSISLTVNGVTYPYPQPSDLNWGTGATNWAQAVTNSALFLSAGSFPITAQLDFGTNFGVKVLSILSETANASGTGYLRLANAEGIGWRNIGNSADYTLLPHADGILQYNSIDLVNLSATQTLTNKSMSGSSNTFTNISLTTAVTGALPIANGGTGQTAKAGAFDALSPTTTKGDVIAYSSTNVRVPVGTDGQVLTADAASTPGVKWATPSANPTEISELYNLGLSTSVAANALTVALKQADGTTNPSTGASAVKIGFRSSTITSGAYNERSATAATSLTVASGATLGMASAVAGTLYVYALDNAGTVELAISFSLFDERFVQSTTALSGSSNSNAVLYSTTARSSVPIRLIGRMAITETTAGTWASNATTLAISSWAGEASNLLAAKYFNATNETLGSGPAIINFATKSIDTNNCVATGTAAWKFTAPIAGVYYVYASMRCTPSSITVGNDFSIGLYKNGSQDTHLDAFDSQVTNSESIQLSGGVIINCALGDTLDVRYAGDTSVTVVNASNHTYISIYKVGNN